MLPNNMSRDARLVSGHRRHREETKRAFSRYKHRPVYRTLSFLLKERRIFLKSSGITTTFNALKGIIDEAYPLVLDPTIKGDSLGPIPGSWFHVNCAENISFQASLRRRSTGIIASLGKSDSYVTLMDRIARGM
jgi:hypothetical protein